MEYGGWVYIMTNKPRGVPYTGVEEAITREETIKAWKRDWKIELIERANPDWDDPSGTVL